MTVYVLYAVKNPRTHLPQVGSAVYLRLHYHYFSLTDFKDKQIQIRLPIRVCE